MWILVGITIFSMFTASLTTILQNLTITKVQDLTGKSVRSLFWIFIPNVCLLLGKLKLMNSVSNKCFYDNSSKILIELDPTECIFCVLVVLQEIAFCLACFCWEFPGAFSNSYLSEHRSELVMSKAKYLVRTGHLKNID